MLRSKTQQAERVLFGSKAANDLAACPFGAMELPFGRKKVLARFCKKLDRLKVENRCCTRLAPNNHNLNNRCQKTLAGGNGCNPNLPASFSNKKARTYT